MLAASLAGVGGNVANLLIRPEAFSLGASTVVMGCIGLLAVLPRAQSLTLRELWKGIFTGISGAVLLFLILGLDPQADVLAHTGGFVSGVILGLSLRLVPSLSQSKWSGRVSFFLLAVLLLASWRLAL